jgi:hypothetical protein
VTSWNIIRWVLVLSIIKGWKSRQLDYIMAYTQAQPIKDGTYMSIPKGFEVDGGATLGFVLQVNKNLYGGCDAGKAWYQHLVDRLLNAGFTKSEYDDCLFYYGNCLYILYTDDSIIIGPTEHDLEACIAAIQGQGLKITVQGSVADFLGVEVTYDSHGMIHLHQCHLVNSILRDLCIEKDNTSVKLTPSPTSKLLSRHSNSTDFDNHFNYRSVIGKLNFLEKSMRPDVAYAVHQCAHFCQDPKVEHGRAVTWLGCYLAATHDKGLILRPDPGKSFEVHANANFAGAWVWNEAWDLDTVRSWTNYAMTFAGCPLLWASKLQSLIALSSTESKLIAASEALRAAIPLFNIAQEALEYGIKFNGSTPLFKTKLFQDNEGAIGSSVPAR